MASAHETTRLISADKVHGTAVYNLTGEKIGSIKNIMIDKSSGRVAYATMSAGGVLGIGSDYYALPWNALRYNTEVDGYQIDVDRSKLEGAPVAKEDDLVTRLEDKEFSNKVNTYYGTDPFWQ